MLPSSELTYNLSWNGVVKAGELTIRFLSTDGEGEVNPQLYAAAEGRSTGPARVLWPYDAATESWVDSARLEPLRVLQAERDRRETNTYRTDFMQPFVQNHWVTIPKSPSKEKEDRQHTFEEALARDLLSSVLFVRSLTFKKKGEKVSLVTFPFRDPFLVELKYLGTEPHKFQGEPTDALKFELDVKKIEKKGTLKSYRHKVKSAYVWMTDDERRLPLELRSEIFVGSIRAKLRNYQPLGKAVPEAPEPKEKPPKI